MYVEYIFMYTNFTAYFNMIKQIQCFKNIRWHACSEIHSLMWQTVCVPN